MAPTNDIVHAMVEIVDYFLPNSDDTSTLEKVRSYAINQKQWEHAHELFDEIRGKTNKAIHNKNKLLVSQYLFEEICAKTLYNMYCYAFGEEDPFDPDSPFWILPLAIDHAKNLDVKNLEEISSILKI